MNLLMRDSCFQFERVFLHFLLSFHLVFGQKSNETDPLEQNLALLSRFPGLCKQGQFDCDEKCIPLKKFHDCVTDCENGYDEQCWAGMIKCDGCRCVDPKDADRICLDRSTACPSKLCKDPVTFQCTFNRCICVYKPWLMDGINDCGDWSDENPCLVGNYSCPANSDCVFTIPDKVSCHCAVGFTLGTGGEDCISESFSIPVTSGLLSSASVSTTFETTTLVQTTTEPPIQTTEFPLVLSNCSVYQDANDSVNSISLAFVFDQSSSMANVNILAASALTSFFEVVKRDPKRVFNWILVPFSDSKIGEITLTKSPVNFLTKMQQMSIKGPNNCAGVLIDALIEAIRLCTPRSIIYVFTNMYLPNEDLLTVTKAAILKSVQINFVITGNCNSTDSIKPINESISYQEIARATHGEVFRINKNSESISKILNYASSYLEATRDTIDIAGGEDKVQIEFPIDGSIKNLLVSATGEKVAVDVDGLHISSEPLYILPNAIVLKVNVSYIAGYKMNVFAQGNGPIVIKISAIAWPVEVFAFTPNPFVPNPFVSDVPVYGVPTYVLLTSRKEINGLTSYDYPVVQGLYFVDPSDDTTVWSGPAFPFRTTPNWEFVAGPMHGVICSFLSIKLDGINKCNEKFRRTSRTTIFADLIDTDIRLPGSCNKAEFDCGNGTCIDIWRVRDCIADCYHGYDEACEVSSSGICGEFCEECADKSKVPLEDRFRCPKPAMFVCSNGNCVEKTAINDGVNQCGDWSDEWEKAVDPSPTTTTEPPWPPIYATTGTPPLEIDLYKRLFNDSCPGSQFQCTDQSCIPFSSFRDCVANCPDGSDEVCPSALFSCGDCKCSSISSSSCRDEQVSQMCETHKDKLHPCMDGLLCVPHALLLDGILDCLDGSDEDSAYLDECYLNIDGCSPLATCINKLDGGYTCECTFGYQGDGRTCKRPYKTS